MKKILISIIILLFFTTILYSDEKEKELDKNVLKMAEKTGKQYSNLGLNLYKESHNESIRFREVEFKKMINIMEKMVKFVADTGSSQAAMSQLKKTKIKYVKLAIKKQNNFLKKLIYLKDQHGELIERHASLSDDELTLKKIKKVYANRETDPFLKEFSKNGKGIKKDWKKIVGEIEKVYLKFISEKK